ncbi:ornithine carbamoyltransferase (OTCase) [Campylobacter devanensis]|uniref:Uncharacterized protein n=1 Tax=Campylobacter devanensis TaxID=3161138 RepID=A0A1X9SRT4_9BACT|nr:MULTISPECIES: ornithine carbamoyltransferase [Campylobacter]MEE3694450.1 hypothetical protein [Campylobacter sp. CLAX-22107-21]ARQ98922.1 hypothetical protein CIGN_0625 [Campylobacter lanienae]MBP3676449.1 ornithine carbamoyltransferase [Campylobacter sp.]MBR2148146.1 ornithine carbamoyltransferase [Campylobacter sp.]MBR2159165.1 ornithine carbamoyltransferase [Campylobacter sp.]
MRVCIDCECLLLAETLRLFLGSNATTKKDCDFIVSDRALQSSKPVFIISDDSPYLSEPFSKDVLLNTLGEFYSAMQISGKIQSNELSSLERRVGDLVDAFKAELIKIIKDEYEK